jgi:hypothetical protein
MLLTTVGQTLHAAGGLRCRQPENLRENSPGVDWAILVRLYGERAVRLLASSFTFSRDAKICLAHSSN